MFGMQEKQNNTNSYGITENPSLFQIAKDLVVRNRFSVTDSETTINNGRRIKLTSVISGAGNTTIAQSNDFLIGVEDLAVARSIELPSAIKAGRGKVFGVKDLVGGAATTTITIASKEGQTIDGAATTTITTDYGTKSFFSNGTNWFTMG